MLGLGLTACGSSPKGTNGDQDELAMLIGTYTNGSSKGIYTFRFNQETGTAVPLSSAALPNPSYLVPSEDGEFVYAVSEMNDSTAALSSLAFDRETGELRLLNTVPTLRRPLLRGHQWPGSVDCQLQRWNHVRFSFTERRHFGSCRHALSRLCHRSRRHTASHSPHPLHGLFTGRKIHLCHRLQCRPHPALCDAPRQPYSSCFSGSRWH